MHIAAILLIKSENGVCILVKVVKYFNYLVSVTAGGSESPQGHM